MLRNKILVTSSRYDLISVLDKILIGVSGGPDSIALLYALNDLKAKLGIKIIVAHLNHGLRKRESDLDEEFTRRQASELGLDFVSKKISWITSKPSEETLRKLRYDFLFECARKYKVKKIAIAHNLDDQAETVLMRIIRGTGLYGLISISPRRKIGDFIIIRPLIETSRKEIIDYLNKIKITPRLDKSNLEDIFLRNKIRNTLLSELSKINPNIKNTLARLAQQVAVDYDFLYKEAKKYLNIESKGVVKIELSRLRKLHLALQRMVVRVALESLTGDLRTFTNKHWQEIDELIKRRPQGSIVNLTKDIHIKKEKDCLRACRNK